MLCNILLMGPRGCGKTAVGRRLAARLGRPFVDLDDVTLARLGQPSVRSVWQNLGEASWREAETAALRRTLEGKGQVIALGGGTPFAATAHDVLRQEQESGRAWIVYLRCPVDVLTRRLAEAPGDRPSLTGGDPVTEIQEVLAAREPGYQALADLVLQAEGEVDEVAEELAAAVPRRAGPGSRS